MSENRVGTQNLPVDLEPRIKRLTIGVVAMAPISEDTEIPHLEGTDRGLYARLCRLAMSLGEVVEDDDALTGEILRDGRRGLRAQMFGGMTNFIKQGSPLEMAASLAHEQGHRYTDAVHNKEAHIISETIAEGSAFVVCDHFDLDISPGAFPYIAGHNKGEFTDEMLGGIQTASTEIIRGLTAQT